MKRFAFLLVFSISSYAQTPSQGDRYPEVRTLLQEAEKAAVGIQFFDDRGSPSSWASRLYARAGYLTDAVRANGGREDAYHIWRARAVYGDLAGAERAIGSISDPERKANALVSLADLLWKMGEPDQARIRLEAARQLVPKIVNPAHRDRMSASIGQGSEYLPKEPPTRISPRPNPPSRPAAQASPLPPFPITPGRFGDRESKEAEAQGEADAAFIAKLYDRMFALDREGLTRLIEAATTPFQKALGIASIEHILIQARQPEAAEQYAKQIPSVDSDCSLAKAEALSAAGAAWLEANNSERAQADFEAAAGLVKSVPDLPFGKFLVVLSIAKAQAKGGMAGSAGATLRLAKDMAQRLPAYPILPAGSRARTPAGVHYRNEAYDKILLAAVEMHDLGAAQEAADLWRLANSRANSDIVEAWFEAGRADDAIAYARGIAVPAQRAEALLVLAQALLNRAGAPNF